MRPPQPRPEVYPLYWYFIAERQAIYERRLAGQPAPWTADPILQQYKFCNVFRAADRVSQYLIHHIVCAPPAADPAERLFQVIFFRLFSRPSLWEAVCAALGHAPTLADLHSGRLGDVLDVHHAAGHKLFTAAFILCATPAYGHQVKHRNYIALLQHMFGRAQAGPALLNAPSLQAVFQYLRDFPLLGNFMAYQIAIDLNYTDLINFSENDFVQPGPGALRGLKKIFLNLGDYSPAGAIGWLVDQQHTAIQAQGLKFNGLWGRPLQAIDAQNVLCETDKYCRVARPNLASNRTTIKATYPGAAGPLTPLPPPLFPPKWGLRVWT